MLSFDRNLIVVKNLFASNRRTRSKTFRRIGEHSTEGSRRDTVDIFLHVKLIANLFLIHKIWKRPKQ